METNISSFQPRAGRGEGICHQTSSSHPIGRWCERSQMWSLSDCSESCSPSRHWTHEEFGKSSPHLILYVFESSRSFASLTFWFWLAVAGITVQSDKKAFYWPWASALIGEGRMWDTGKLSWVCQCWGSVYGVVGVWALELKLVLVVAVVLGKSLNLSEKFSVLICIMGIINNSSIIGSYRT